MKKVATVLLLSALSGVALALCLPPGQAGFLGWVCMAPMLIGVCRTRFIVGFAAGLFTCFVAAYVVLSGLPYAHKAPHEDPSWVFTGIFLFSFAVSIMAGLWAELSRTERPVWWFAGLAVLLEACLLIILPGHLSLSLGSSPFVMLASLGGVWLMSFCIWSVNIWTAQSIASSRWLQLTVPFILAVFTLVPWRSGPNSGTFKVAVLQYGDGDSTGIVGMHKEVRDASLAIWPEYSGEAAVMLGDSTMLQQVARHPGIIPFITTFSDGSAPKPHNTAVLFAGDSVSEPYAKRKLFGGESRTHAPGTKAVSVALRDRVIGLNICFDSCYPWIVRETARMPEVNLIALPNLDPQSPHAFIAGVHAAFTNIRAAELGMPFARADTRAYSQIVNSYGQTVAVIEPGLGAATGSVDSPHWTPARQFGDWFLYLCVGLSLWPVMTKRLHRSTDADQEQNCTVAKENVMIGRDS